MVPAAVFFRHTEDNYELQKRFLVAKKKLQACSRRKRERWGHTDSASLGYTQHGFGDHKGDSDYWGARGAGYWGAARRWS